MSDGFTCPDCGKPREMGKRCKRCTKTRMGTDLALRCQIRAQHIEGHRSLSGFSKAVAILKDAAEKNGK